MVIIVGIIFAIVGIVLTFIGIKKQINCTEVTSGKVVDISREVNNIDRNNTSTSGIQIGNVSLGSTNHQVSLYPIYEYTVGENTYIEKSSTSVNGAFIGQAVDIHYNPNKPTEFYTGKIGMIMQIVLGVIFAIVGIIVICLGL